MDDRSYRRAKTLLEQMTTAEKVGQLNQHLYGFRIYRVENNAVIFSDELKDEVEKFGGLGIVYGLYRADPWSERDFKTGLPGVLAVEAYNALQRYVMDRSRLHIPIAISSECPHGHQALDGYLLPVNLAVGATFHPELLEQAAHICGRQLRGMGVDMALVSALDVVRDPRWGRSEECYGEDPYLSTLFAKAVVKGMQAENVAVVAKHFCAQGETTGGINASAARIGERELREIHLPSTRACCEAGVKGIMAAYNEIDGILCHANKKLLRDILREELGFTGFVMADGLAVDQLDCVTGDTVRSAALALSSGVDISLWDEGYTKLETALRNGLITQERLDEAVLRILAFKYEQGLFDKPFIDGEGNRTDTPPVTASAGKAQFPVCSADSAVGTIPACADIGRDDTETSMIFSYREYTESERLARESVVLLKNEAVLPIGERQGRIALIGPAADDLYGQLGDYTPPQRRGECMTIRDGLQRLYGARIRYADGTDRDYAKKLAAESEVVIVCLGGSSSRFSGVTFAENGAAKTGSDDRTDCGEGVDVARLELPDRQEQLFRELRGVCKKLITVIVAGRAYAVEEIAERTDALLYCFYPGPMGGKAIGDILSGLYSPSGRLPVSLPRCAGQLPVYYNRTISYPALRYQDVKGGALYTFGEGMGYGELLFSDICIEESGDELLVKGRIENRHSRSEYAVIQCYRKVLSGSLVPRERELAGIQKTEVPACGTVAFCVRLDRSVFRFYTPNGERIDRCMLLVMDGGRILYECEVNGS